MSPTASVRAMIRSNRATQPQTGPSTLELKTVTAGYGRATVLRGVDLTVGAGEVVALLGPNGAGKTTLLRVAAGQLRPSEGSVLIGSRDVTRARANQRVRSGLCLIPEGRGIFRRLTVRENLELQVPPWDRTTSIDVAVDAFPILGERLNQVAGSMSGGQQQMLALSRAMLARSSIVMLDEVSMGLAPKVVDQIFEVLHTMARAGVGLLLVEQYVHRAMDMADRIYVLQRGTIALTGRPDELDEESLVREYLGGATDR